MCDGAENDDGIVHSPPAAREWSWQPGWQLPTPTAAMPYAIFGWPPQPHPTTYSFPFPTLPMRDLQQMVEDAVQRPVQAALPSSLHEGPQQPPANTPSASNGPTPTTETLLTTPSEGLMAGTYNDTSAQYGVQTGDDDW